MGGFYHSIFATRKDCDITPKVEIGRSYRLILPTTLPVTRLKIFSWPYLCPIIHK
jgi:hypothetical protein